MAGFGIEVRICLWKVSTIGRHDCWKLSQSSLCLGLKCKEGKCHTKTLFLVMFPFLPASRNIASTEKVSSFEGPIILKKDLQVIEALSVYPNFYAYLII